MAPETKPKPLPPNVGSQPVRRPPPPAAGRASAAQWSAMRLCLVLALLDGRGGVHAGARGARRAGRGGLDGRAAHAGRADAGGAGPRRHGGGAAHGAGRHGRAPRGALRRNDIDVYWDYTGAAWVLGMQGQVPPADPEESYEQVRSADAEIGLEWLAPTTANATLALFVRAEDAVPEPTSRGWRDSCLPAACRCAPTRLPGPPRRLPVAGRGVLDRDRARADRRRVRGRGDPPRRLARVLRRAGDGDVGRGAARAARARRRRPGDLPRVRDRPRRARGPGPAARAARRAGAPGRPPVHRQPRRAQRPARAGRRPQPVAAEFLADLEPRDPLPGRRNYPWP